jgi:hypothetical protein
VKHGRWIKWGNAYECSNCDVPLGGMSPRCPYCGAYMDLGLEEVNWDEMDGDI